MVNERLRILNLPRHPSDDKAILFSSSATSAAGGVLWCPPKRGAWVHEEPKISDEQIAPVEAATKDYLITDLQSVLKAIANGMALMSEDGAIAKHRLLESYCKQFAACLSSNLADAATRETVLRGTFCGFSVR
jgi:hypothetical protein